MSGKAITFGRYQKVEAILEADVALKAKLGPKTEIVCRPPPSNEKCRFSLPVVYFTEELHANGADAHTTSKTDVLKLALKLLQDGDGEFKLPDRKPAEPDPTPPPEKPKAQKPKAVAAPKLVVKKPVSAAAVVAKAKAAAAAAKKPEQPKKEAQSSPKSEPAPSEVPSADAGNSHGEVAKPVLVEKPGMVNGFPLAYGVSLVTLLMTADQIMEAHDRFPGRKERQQKLADLIAECQKLTVVKGAKETAASA